MDFSDSGKLLREQDMDTIRLIITPATNRLVDWLHYACYSSTPDNGAVVAHILDCGVPVNSTRVNNQGWTVLHYAVNNDKIDCVRVLLSRGADVELQTGFGDRPLFFSFMNRSMRCARILIDYGAQIITTDRFIYLLPWAFSFSAKRLRVRQTSVVLMGALKMVRMNRDLIPLIGQWVWATRGVE
jgi:hypothetical protein